jgi:hypothetical protein
MMLTFQDFEQEQNKAEFIRKAIQEHLASEEYRTALSADNYDHEKNETIYNYVRIIFSMLGTPIEDFTASNAKITSNFFHRLNTQRCTYLLGNGVSFTEHKQTVIDANGVTSIIDETKNALGKYFDNDLKTLGYYALIHGRSFGFWNVDRLKVFPITEFKPIMDEETGDLRVGIRFWRVDAKKPMYAVLYEEDGYTKYRTDEGANNLEFHVLQEKRAYRINYQYSEVDGEQVTGVENYSRLPIVPMWGSKLKQSTLIGMRNKIDSFDLIRSGFANDLTDCSQIYWILENCGGMSAAELAQFRDRLKINHIAVVDTGGGAKATPYTQDIPYQALKQYLDDIRAQIYEDFGGLDVHTVAAGATNDHIDAAYQPMDEEADDFEYQVIEFIQQILSLIGIEDTPQFKRNRISNQSEQTQMILSAADYLDDETILQKLPFVSVDEVMQILAKRDVESQSRFEEDEEDDTSSESRPEAFS